MAIPGEPPESPGWARSPDAKRPVAPDFPTRQVLARRLVARYAEIINEPESLVEALLRPLPVTLWSNRLRLSRDVLQALLERSGLESRPMGWNGDGLYLPPGHRPGQHWGFMAGLFQMQEEVSMLPVHLLNPQPGERVLDLCAAPGNKTAQIAVAMGNTGTVVANELNRGRIPAIRQTLKRLGLMNVAITVQDGQSLPARVGMFDRVLVDAPCTCEGTFRKVRVPQMVSDAFRERSARVQHRLLRRAVQLTRPGGRIVYSTCTFSPEENEAVVDAVLGEFPDALCLLPARVDGFAAGGGLSGWRGRAFDPRLSLTMRVWPHREDTGGFFVAVLEKRGEGQLPGPGEDYFRPPAESPDWFGPFLERLGMEPEVFARVQPVRRGNRYLHFLPADHRLPRAPAPDMLGLPAVRRRSLPLKPTTAVVMLFGHRATRNWLVVDDQQCAAYLRREDSDLDPRQLEHCTGPGYVVVQYQGQVLGLGQLIYDRERPRVWLKSLMPRAWSTNIGEPPGGEWA
ncbi:MAG: class I SAM-dependent methyltransferase [Ectothiorhodospiraceae bacterium]|nr:class I SAM-dependent methyltransferase [Ectothiorhodospiraceae bacterium]